MGAFMFCCNMSFSPNLSHFAILTLLLFGILVCISALLITYASLMDENVLFYLFGYPFFSLASLHLKERMHELIGGGLLLVEGRLLVEHQDPLRVLDPALRMHHQDMVDDFSLRKHGRRLCKPSF